MSFDGNNIVFSRTKILSVYNEYRDEQNKFSNGVSHYAHLFNIRQIYK